MFRVSAAICAGILLFLTGCAPAPIEPAPPLTPPLAPSGAVAPAENQAAEGGDAPVDSGIRGLQEREPDVCGASAFQVLVGQPAEAAANLPTDKPVRVIPFGAIVTQEYIPNRINVRLDPEGIILRIDCG